MGNTLKTRSSSKIFQERKKKLEIIAARIERRMAELEKIVTDLSKGL